MTPNSIFLKLNCYTGESHEFQYLWGLDSNGAYQGLGGIGGLLAIIHKNANKIYLPLMDKKGSVQTYIDAETGKEVAKFAYTPYGDILSAEGPMAALLSLRYNTKYFDQEVNIYYHETRYYNPTTSKWLSRDPIGESGGLNLYAYCNNDPVNGIDYLGCKAYIAYRALNITGLKSTFPLSGHVYIAFDDEGIDKVRWKKELEKWARIAIGSKNNIDPNAKIHTFSFHPWDVRHPGAIGRADAEYRVFPMFPAITDSSDIFYRDLIDVQGIRYKTSELAELTSDTDKQIEFFNIVVRSWQINSESPKNKDNQYYSFLHYNCGNWAVWISQKGGFTIPSEVEAWNVADYYQGPSAGYDIKDALYYFGRVPTTGIDLFKYGIKAWTPSFPKTPKPDYTGFGDYLEWRNSSVWRSPHQFPSRNIPIP